MPLRMELGSSGITSLRDWADLPLGDFTLLAGSNVRTECKCSVLTKDIICYCPAAKDQRLKLLGKYPLRE